MELASSPLADASGIPSEELAFPSSVSVLSASSSSDVELEVLDDDDTLDFPSGNEDASGNESETCSRLASGPLQSDQSCPKRDLRLLSDGPRC